MRLFHNLTAIRPDGCSRRPAWRKSPPVSHPGPLGCSALGGDTVYTGSVDCCDVDTPATPPAVGDSPRVALGRAGPALGAVAVALLPKCPACWSVYAGLSSLLGLSIALDERYLLPLTCGLLVLSIGALVLQAQRGRGHGPWRLAAGAAVLILLGKFVWASDPCTYAGAAGLLFASLWSRRGPRRPAAAVVALGSSKLTGHAEAR
jgi:mercuric ion transport protein